MELLRRALRKDPDITLDVAALEMASIECPGVLAARYLVLLDGMAFELHRRLGPRASGASFVNAMNDYLFRELGFRGNAADFYNPKNSCLNVVLDSRLGIPITLSLVYIELARRLDRKILGVGLPGHFVVQYRDHEWTAYIDPFHGGRRLTEADCRELALDNAQVDIAGDPSALRPVTNAYILTRMLNNLRGSYFRSGQFAKAALVLDLLIESSPETVDYYKARAVAHLQTRRFAAATGDFQTYLERCPDAADRDDIRKQMEAIHRWLGALN